MKQKNFDEFMIQIQVKDGMFEWGIHIAKLTQL